MSHSDAQPPHDTFAAAVAHARRAAVLGSIDALLGWDERTKMPPAGGSHRADQAAALAVVVHRERTDPRQGERLDRLLDDPRARHGTPQEQAANDLAARTYEFGEFLVRRLGVEDVGARFPHRVTYHDGCHGLRELRVKDEPRRLLRAVRDLELVECDEPESCCGFGGLFSVKFPMISTAMAEVKGSSLARTECDYIVSSDPSCQLQLDGWLSRQGKKPRTIHLAEVLAGDALLDGGRA
jgi:hypothetical protein